MQNLEYAKFKAKHYSQEGGCDAIINNWYEGNDIFIGGYDITVEVIAKAGNNFGKILGRKQIRGGPILGKNPEAQVVQDYASTPEMKAIVKHESLLKRGVPLWLHFNEQDNGLNYPDKGYYLEGHIYNRKGYPEYGVPNGYGICKIDNSPSPTEMDLWNWKHNIDTGRNRLETSKSTETGFELTEGSANSDKYYWMNVFQFYNTGNFKAKRYWSWDEINKIWKLNKYTKVEYCKAVYDYYKTFIQ